MSDWPKWVVPHKSHIKTRSVSKDGGPHHPGFAVLDEGAEPRDHVFVQGFEFHRDRVTGDVTVLVANEEQEAAALAAKVDPTPAAT